MLPQSSELNEQSTSAPKEEQTSPHLFSIFGELSTTSNEVNRIGSSPVDRNNFERPVFEKLKLLAEMSQITKPSKPLILLSRIEYPLPIQPPTPVIHPSQWKEFTIPESYRVDVEPMTDEQLMKMRGPSRLINFLVHIAMKKEARRALRWTGHGLEFILVNKELVAKMWGNRKNNTKDMDYYKLSRAIREKYEKKDKSKSGKLKKGLRTYSYVFTENSYQDLENETKWKIERIMKFAESIGKEFQDNNDLHHSMSPHSPNHSD